MRPCQSTILAAACSAALTGAASAQTTGMDFAETTSATTAVASATGGANAPHVQRIESRFGTFAGSSANLDSLAGGLRSGTEITLTGSGETTTFSPPTRPMGYGNVTRALDLAQRQLAAAGITDPTPQEIQASLTGGTVSGSNGDVQLAGVLQLRSEGMGWGQIAHAIGVHPGLGKPISVAAPTTGGTTISKVGTAGSRSSVVTATGGKPAAVSVRPNRAAASGISTANGRSGIVTAAGGNPLARSHGLGAGRSAAATTTAAGAGGSFNASKGQGNAFGHTNK